MYFGRLKPLLPVCERRLSGENLQNPLWASGIGGHKALDYVVARVGEFPNTLSDLLPRGKNCDMGRAQTCPYAVQWLFYHNLQCKATTLPRADACAIIQATMREEIRDGTL